MLLTSPPPISMDKLAAQLALLPSLSLESFGALWAQYFDSRPRRRSRNWLIDCLARKIQEVACAEYEMEQRVSRKLKRAARMRAHRQMPRGCMLQGEVKSQAMVAPTIDINELINSYLTLCPDLTYGEALWLVCRVRPLRVAWSGLSHDCDAPHVAPSQSCQSSLPAQPC